MKSTSKSVSIPEELVNFANLEMESKVIPSFSAYVCELIRERRDKAIAAEVALLESATENVTAGEPASEFWREFYAEVHAERSQKATNAA